MVDLAITINAKNLQSVEQSLLTAPEELALAQRRAINATISQSRNEVRRDIPLNMPEKLKNRALYSYGAKRRKLEGVLGARYFDTPLTWFSGWRERRGAYTFRAATRRSSGVKANKRLAGASNAGLFVRWYKGGQTVRIKSGFIMRSRGGIGGRAFMRAPRSFGRKQGRYYPTEVEDSGPLVPRLAVWPIYGPSVYEEFVEILPRYEKRVAVLYLKKLGAQINYILSQR